MVLHSLYPLARAEDSAYNLSILIMRNGLWIEGRHHRMLVQGAFTRHSG